MLLQVQKANGKIIRTIDFNQFNVTTGERFATQHEFPANLQVDTNMTVPPSPPEPSYKLALDKKKMPLGKNLVSEDFMRSVLKPTKLAADDPAKPAVFGKIVDKFSFTCDVKAGNTYMVEFLAAVSDPEKITKFTRVEIAVTGKGRSKNLPVSCHLPLDRLMKRSRFAFRADQDGQVQLTLKAVEPGTEIVEPNNMNKLTYTKSIPSETGLLVGDIVVAQLKFTSRNLLLNRELNSRSASIGELDCTAKYYDGAISLYSHKPFELVKASIRCLDGIIANQGKEWTAEVNGKKHEVVNYSNGLVDYAQGIVSFKKPIILNAIALYEDNSGPVITTEGIKETASKRFCIHLRDAKTNKWLPLVHKSDNTNLVNIFTCPSIEINAFRYFWTGRIDAQRNEIDGKVHLIEIEAYADELESIFNNVTDDPGDGAGGLGL